MIDGTGRSFGADWPGMDPADSGTVGIGPVAGEGLVATGASGLQAAPSPSRPARIAGWHQDIEKDLTCD